MVLSACCYFWAQSTQRRCPGYVAYSPANGSFLPLTQDYAWKEKSADEETRKYSDKLRDVYALAERLGCSFGQLAIAWSLKNESVQCLLLGASNIDQLYESLQSLQVTRTFISREVICTKRYEISWRRIYSFFFIVTRDILHKLSA